MNDDQLRYRADCADIRERFINVFRPDEIWRIDEAHFMGVRLRDMSKTELMLALMAISGMYNRVLNVSARELTFDGIPVGPMKTMGEP